MQTVQRNKMRERELITRFNSGETIPAREFNRGGLDFFAAVVHPLAIRDKATRQLDFYGEIHYTRVTPLYQRTPEDEHLCRPVKPKEPIRIISRLDQDKLALAREQLRKDMRT